MFKRTLGGGYGCVALLAALGWALPAWGVNLITAVTVTNGDGPISGGVDTQRENDLDGTIVYFNEDVFSFTDRTHEYNGARYDSGTGLLSTSGDTIVPLPSYLVGGEYIATRNSNRDNPVGFQIDVTVSRDVWAYLLIDNRLGDSTSSNPPTLGSGGVGLMAWVADDGWTQYSTGLFPNNQPDYVGVDEGGSVSNWAARTHLATTGPGNGLNQFSTVYRKRFTGPGIITLKEQAGGNLNMYGLVVTPEPATMGLLVLGAAGLAARRRRH
ncbi:MAG: PEP-CTERM sorting domain-containing protein [Phycisphaerae bacterium]|jgi:hypothetical protein